MTIHIFNKRDPLTLCCGQDWTLFDAAELVIPGDEARVTCKGEER